MLGTLVINGMSSDNYNMYLTDAGIYGMAERDIEKLKVAGRNGDLLLDNHRYNNVPLSYPAIIRDDFARNYQDFMDFILSNKGYMRVEDSFNPDIFMFAVYTGEVDAKKVERYGKDGVFNMTFERKPERYLKSGEFPIEITSNTSIFNQYRTDALPIVRVYGTGALTIGDTTITINSVSEYVDIDCETQDAYKGSTNCNGNITLNNGDFFKLKSGANAVTMANTITKIVVVPRWWTL